MKKVKKIKDVYILKIFKGETLLRVSDYGFASYENAKEYLEKKGCVRKYKDEEIESLALWAYSVFTKDGYDIEIVKLFLLDN